MKVSLTIDLNKLDKTRIQERKYTDSTDKEVVVREYKLDVVPLKDDKRKVIKEGDGWKMVKSHFVCDTATKEERELKKATNFVGEGITFEDGSEQPPF